MCGVFETREKTPRGGREKPVQSHVYIISRIQRRSRCSQMRKDDLA